MKIIIMFIMVASLLLFSGCSSKETESQYYCTSLNQLQIYKIPDAQPSTPLFLKVQNISGVRELINLESFLKNNKLLIGEFEVKGGKVFMTMADRDSGLKNWLVVSCTKGHKVGENPAYYYCGGNRWPDPYPNVFFMGLGDFIDLEKAILNKDSTIAENLKISATVVFDENLNYVKTICVNKANLKTYEATNTLKNNPINSVITDKKDITKEGYKEINNSAKEKKPQINTPPIITEGNIVPSQINTKLNELTISASKFNDMYNEFKLACGRNTNPTVIKFGGNLGDVTKSLLDQVQKVKGTDFSKFSEAQIKDVDDTLSSILTITQSELSGMQNSTNVMVNYCQKS